MEKQSIITIEKVENGYLVAIEKVNRTVSLFGDNGKQEREWFIAKDYLEISKILKNKLSDLKTRKELNLIEEIDILDDDDDDDDDDETED